jgi:hypothetical protein
MYDKHLYTAYGYIVETDKTLRDLEREWSRTGSDDAANALLKAFHRAGQTNHAKYYAVLWATGGRPRNDLISRRAIYLSDSLDNMIINYANAQNISIAFASDKLGAISNIPQRGMDAYTSRIHLAIGNPGKLDRKHMLWIIKFIDSIIKKASKLRISNNDIRYLSMGLDGFQVIAGVEP